MVLRAAIVSHDDQAKQDVVGKLFELFKDDLITVQDVTPVVIKLATAEDETLVELAHIQANHGLIRNDSKAQLVLSTNTGLEHLARLQGFVDTFTQDTTKLKFMHQLIVAEKWVEFDIDTWDIIFYLPVHGDEKLEMFLYGRYPEQGYFDKILASDGTYRGKFLQLDQEKAADEIMQYIQDAFGLNPGE